MQRAALPIGVSLRNRAEVKSIAFYYELACGISWTCWVPLMLGSDGLKLVNLDIPGPIFISLGTLGPFVASLSNRPHLVRQLAGSTDSAVAWSPVVLGQCSRPC